MLESPGQRWAGGMEKRARGGLGFARPARYRSAMSKTATHDPEAQTFTIRGSGWWDTYPIADLPKWLAFYRKMDADYPKAAGQYAGTVAALEALTAQLRVKVA